MPAPTDLGIPTNYPGNPVDYLFGIMGPEIINRYLHKLMSHRHDGATGDTSTAPLPPDVEELDVEGGKLIADRNVYYRVATIDEDGIESPASVSNFLHTSGPLAMPDVDGSNFEILTTGGALEAGVYQYAITAWQGTPSASTLGLPVTLDLQVANGNEQQVSITLPDLPAGADGFNIYRRFPGSVYFYRIAVLTGEQVDPYVDSDGEEVEAPFVVLPERDESPMLRTVRVTRPAGATTWAIYRSYDDTDWTGTRIAISSSATYDDDGIGAEGEYRSPIEAAGYYHNPDPVTALELSEVPAVATLASTGASATGVLGEWTCPYDEILVAGLGLTLDQGTTPGSQALNADLQHWTGSTWETIVAGMIGTSASSDDTPGPATPADAHFSAGDRFRINVTQVGSGGTGLTAHIRLWARATADSELWSAPTWPTP